MGQGFGDPDRVPLYVVHKPLYYLSCLIWRLYQNFINFVLEDKFLFLKIK